MRIITNGRLENDTSYKTIEKNKQTSVSALNFKEVKYIKSFLIY